MFYDIGERGVQVLLTNMNHVFKQFEATMRLVEEEKSVIYYKPLTSKTCNAFPFEL